MATAETPTKIFVYCKFAFYDQYLQPVAQRTAYCKASFFALEKHGDSLVYVLDCKLNEQNLFIQRDMLFANDYLMRAEISTRHITRTEIGRTAHTFALFDTTPFSPGAACKNDFTVPIYPHAYFEEGAATARLYTAVLKCGTICAGMSLEVPVASMLRFAKNRDMFFAQYLLDC